MEELMARFKELDLKFEAGTLTPEEAMELEQMCRQMRATSGRSLRSGGSRAPSTRKKVVVNEAVAKKLAERMRAMMAANLPSNTTT